MKEKWPDAESEELWSEGIWEREQELKKLKPRIVVIEEELKILRKLVAERKERDGTKCDNSKSKNRKQTNRNT